MTKQLYLHDSRDKRRFKMKGAREEHITQACVTERQKRKLRSLSATTRAKVPHPRHPHYAHAPVPRRREKKPCVSERDTGGRSDVGEAPSTPDPVAPKSSDPAPRSRSEAILLNRVTPSSFLQTACRCQEGQEERGFGRRHDGSLGKWHSCTCAADKIL
uniref:Uncharacterized protein n=1 Tax=Knipowitschia caucasica TaxID=637954 RepID=A0AAV2J6G2_KNICA